MTVKNPRDQPKTCSRVPEKSATAPPDVPALPNTYLPALYFANDSDIRGWKEKARLRGGREKFQFTAYVGPPYEGGTGRQHGSRGPLAGSDRGAIWPGRQR